MNWWRTAQRQLVERPHLPVTAALGFAGAIALFRGGLVPATMDEALPTWLVYFWTIGVAAGGFVATFGALASRNRAEAAGLAFLLYGSITYSVVVGFVGWPGSFVASVMLASVACMCAIRMRVLSYARKVEDRTRGDGNA